MLPIYSRTPVATAQQAATIDEYSGGRMVLGLGVSHAVTVENWYGTKIERPLQRDARVRRGRARDASRGEDPPEGEIFRSRFRFMGYEPRADLPIYVAALSPKMLRLAGEIADGVMLWLCNPDYIRDVVVPEVRGGPRAGRQDARRLRRRRRGAGRRHRRPAAAYETMRNDLITYWSLPFYRAMIERSGFGDDIAAFDEGIEAATWSGPRRRSRTASSTPSPRSDRPTSVRAGIDALRATRAPPRPASAPCRARTSSDAGSRACECRSKTCRWTDVGYLGIVTDDVTIRSRTRINPHRLRSRIFAATRIASRGPSAAGGSPMASRCCGLQGSGLRRGLD